MRTHRWLKALAFGCCLGAGADAAFAQAPFLGGGQGQWVNADGSAPAAASYAPPGSFQPAYSTNDPSVLYPPGTPPSYAPWPTMSPYGMGNYAQDTLYNQNGNWFREILNKRRDYYFSVDALSTTTSAPGHTTIGARTIPLDHVTGGPKGFPLPTYGDAPFDGSTTGGGNNGGGTVVSTAPLSRVFVDNRVDPYPFMHTSTTVISQTIDNTIFPIRNMRLFSEWNTPGVMLNWGFDEEDGSGFRADAWWGFQGNQTFQRGEDQINGVVIDQQLILNTEGQILFTRNGAVTFDTGIPNPGPAPTQSGVYGTTIGAQKYDVLYRVNVKSEAGGGDLQMYLPDLFTTTSAFRLRPVYGAKYMFIGESFQFRGIDSGMSYTINGVTGGTGGTGGNGGTGTSSTYRPDPWGTTGPVTIDADVFETQVNSYTRTHLAGPTAGLRLDLGRNKNFKIWGQSNFGLMANYETVRVNGFNAGEIVETTFLTGNNMLQADSHFSDEQNHAHVSPLFEQTFMSESKILAALPGTREIPFLANANFRVGYTGTFVGQVARPAESIHWYGFPKTPKVDIDYQNWSMGRLNFGLEWTY